MNQVADTDLADFLQSTGNYGELDPRKMLRRKQMQPWPGCLIQAIDYLHEMRVKHKAIKPANILIANGQVLLADFRISKDMIDKEKTASLSGSIGTRLYCAPEVLTENHRRGRATDIFSLGCVFLEISTVLLCPPRNLELLQIHRQRSGSQIYSSCGIQILCWIRYLWGRYSEYCKHCQSHSLPYDDVKFRGTAPADMAFLMLDPSPKTRITARQMVALVQVVGTDFYDGIREKSCASCWGFPPSHISKSNIPFHSVYKGGNLLDYPEIPGIALASISPTSWDEAKRLWLSEHMWW